jgi:hypothetical protein
MFNKIVSSYLNMKINMNTNANMYKVCEQVHIRVNNMNMVDYRIILLIKKFP